MHDLRFGIFTPPDLSWCQALASWQLIEELGFDCAAVTDHFMSTSEPVDRPFPEAWTMLTALACHTSRLRIAVLVSGNTYRNPVLLAKQAVTLDHVSGGRLDLGIGAGWYEDEHRRYGWPFPSAGDRVAMLEEALQVIEELFTRDRTTFSGNYYRLQDAPFQPKPVQPGGIPMIVGGQRRRMMGLVARYADIWSIDYGPEEMKNSARLLTEQCQHIGRDPGEIRRSGFVVARRVGRDPFNSVNDFLAVTSGYLAAGASEIYFKMPLPDQLPVLYDAAKLLPGLRDTHRKSTLQRNQGRE